MSNKHKKDDDMDAWEIDLRIQMAEKQKKYTEINRKLKKIEKHKNRLPENLKRNTKHFAPVFEETLQSKSDYKSLQKLANEVDITCDSTKSITEKENGHTQSSIVDSFQTSKKSYLAPQNIQDSHTKHEENKSFEKCLEHEFIK